MLVKPLTKTAPRCLDVRVQGRLQQERRRFKAVSTVAYDAELNAPRRPSLFALLAEQRRFIYLVVALSSLGARQVLFAITRPIEEAISVVQGVTRAQSRSIRGGSEINVTFSQTTDMAYALQQVQGCQGATRD